MCDQLGGTYFYDFKMNSKVIGFPWLSKIASYFATSWNSHDWVVGNNAT